VRVVWTETAISQLEAIYNHVAQTSPEYALRLVDRLTGRSIQIAKFPFSGLKVPEHELNEVRQVLQGSYRIIYLIKEAEKRVEVLAVIHTTREGLEPLE
jgi:toxin ParE1/3/4